MKLSKPLCALILIVSALLLSAESPSPRPTTKPNESATLSNDETKNQVAPIGAPNIPQPAPDTGASGNKSEDGSDTATKVIAFFTIVAALATIAIAKFSKQLVSVTAEMHQVTKLALKIDRPYLILDHAQLTDVLHPQLNILMPPPRFFPRLVLDFHNYGKGPVIFREALIRIDALHELPPARDFSGCERMSLRENAVSADKDWHPLAQFNYEADWSALFPDIAAEKKRLVAYGCVRYTDPVGENTYETGFCWIFIPPRTELHTMPKAVRELLAPYRAPGAPDPEAPIASKMPGDFVRGPASHNYNT